MSEDISMLKDAFVNSGLLKKPRPIKHDTYYDPFHGQECSPWCEACKIEKGLSQGKKSE